MFKTSKVIGVCLAIGLLAAPLMSVADGFKLGIMQDKKGVAQKYTPLVAYLKLKGVDVSLVGLPNYTAAAKMFATGELDGMFSGSGVAGTMIIKELADPVVRPVATDGTSTYWAVILARKGAPAYTGRADYFSGKKVLLTSLASSGEFYYRALEGSRMAPVKLLTAASHGAAIDALSRGAADYAIVKNRVWDKEKGKYPDLVVVGQDKGENPNGTLIVAKTVPVASVARIAAALQAVGEDGSGEAQAVREGLALRGYIVTAMTDFDHTLSLLRSAGVDKSFDFSF